MWKALSYSKIFNPNNIPVRQGRNYFPFHIRGIETWKCPATCVKTLVNSRDLIRTCPSIQDYVQLKELVILELASTKN